MNDLEQQELEFSRLLSRAAADDASRAEHRAALRTQMLAAYAERQASAKSTPVWKRTYQHGRAIMQRPIPRLVAMSVPCVLLLLGWIFLREEKSAAAAFHTFANTLVTAKTARFDMEATITGQPQVKVKALYQAPARYRQIVGDIVSISDMQAGKMVTLNPAKKTAVVVILKGLADADKQGSENDLFGRLRNLLASQDQSDKKYQVLGEKEIGGRRAVGFRLDSPMAMVTLWGDPETGLPVRIDTVMSGAPRIEVTMSEFEIDVDLEVSLFDTTPPAGYQVQTFEMDASPYKEADLVESLRIAGDLDDGKFPDQLDTATSQHLVVKAMRTDKQLNNQQAMEKAMQLTSKIGRGFSFALQLPESTGAHYAGQGVKRDAKDTPVFWYRPEGSKAFRVIYADLTMKDMDAAPKIPGAVPVYKSSVPAGAAAPQAKPK
jgi:outer membrane lipoprotein-sorting protein